MYACPAILVVAESVCVRDQRYNVAIKAYGFCNAIDLSNGNNADFAAAITAIIIAFTRGKGVGKSMIFTPIPRY